MEVSVVMADMTRPIELDFSQSNADMRELVQLANLSGWNLFEYLRLLSEAGAPVLRCQVDEATAMATERRIGRYQLSEALLVVLAAMRARHLNQNNVESAASDRSAFSERRSTSCRLTHGASLDTATKSKQLNDSVICKRSPCASQMDAGEKPQ
jgi:hypothetical protein